MYLDRFLRHTAAAIPTAPNLAAGVSVSALLLLLIAAVDKTVCSIGALSSTSEQSFSIEKSSMSSFCLSQTTGILLGT